MTEQREVPRVPPLRYGPRKPGGSEASGKSHIGTHSRLLAREVLDAWAPEMPTGIAITHLADGRTILGLGDHEVLLSAQERNDLIRQLISPFGDFWERIVVPLSDTKE